MTKTKNKENLESSVFSKLNAPDIYLKISSFDPAFFLGWQLIRVQCLLMKCSFLSFFQVDLLLLILRDPGAVCQGNAFSIRPTPGSPGPPKMITVRTHYPK